MNVTGYGQYSKAAAGARNPKKNMDSQLKLIFIYPILISDRIRVQSTPPFDQTMRDFISVTFLSDLFVENAFSIVGAANQIRPLWDERNNPIDTATGLLRFQAAQQGISSSGYGTTPPNYTVDAGYSGVLQQKIAQKTAVIQQLIRTDPKFARFRPYIETITMGNMIEVPVIIGTASYQVDTLTLMWVLIAAIGLNLPMNSEANIDKIFNELENLDEKKYWRLLNNLTQSPEAETNFETLGTWFQRGVLGVARGVRFATRRFNILPSVRRAAHSQIQRTRNQIRSDSQQGFQSQQQFAPLFLNRTKLDETKTYFKFVLNPHNAETRFGLDARDSATSRTRVYESMLAGQSSRYRNILLQSFDDTMATAGTILLLSIGNLSSISSSNLNVVEKKDEMFNDMNISDIVDKLFKSIQDSLQEEDPSENIKSLKELCSIDSSEAFDHVSTMIGKTAISSGVFDQRQYLQFVDQFEKASATSKALSQKIENHLNTIVTNKSAGTFNTNLILIKNDISMRVQNFLKEFVDEHHQTGTDFAIVTATQQNTDNMKVLNQIIPSFSSGVANILYFLFLSHFQSVLCKYILVADVELERAAHEVTSWPNYTLVLPVEIVVALHAAIMGKSWSHMLSGGRIGRSLDSESRPVSRGQVRDPDVSATYMRSIVNFISRRLNVPNLIVVDSRSGEVHYQLMNQTSVNRSRIQTLATFIQSKVDRPLSVTQTQNYY